MEIIYRGYQVGDTPAILELYNTAFAAPRTTAQWQWEYADNPLGRCDIVLAFAGGRLIGHSAAVPLGFRDGSQTVEASRIQNVVVHPDFQRRGIFTETLIRLTEQLTVRGVDFAVSFPNDERHSLPGFMRTGLYTNVFDLLPWVLPLPLPTPMPPGVRIEIDDEVLFHPDDVGCAERILEPFAICNRRDLQYLNWRFKPASGRRYTVARVWLDGIQVGWVVAKPYAPARSLDLVECFLPPQPPLVAAMLGALAERFRGEALHHVSLWSADHYPLHACLLDLGFTAEPRPTHVLVAPLSARCSPLRTTPSAYYLAMGDSDVY